MKNLVISFSGGKTSGMMCWHIKNNPKYKDFNKLFIFANTGKEREETLDFVDKCDKTFKLNLVWVESVVTPIKGIGIKAITTNFQNASRNGEPFEAVISKQKEVPSIVAPYCSEKLKKIPINKFAKEYFGTTNYLSALGMRFEDMPQRVCNYQVFNIVDKKIYPLLSDFDHFLTRKDVNDFWKNQDFNLNLKPYEGNCDLCWKKNNKLKAQIIKENPSIATWWDKMEKKYGGEFHYEEKTTQDLILMSNNMNQITLFEGCFCS